MKRKQAQGQRANLTAPYSGMEKSQRKVFPSLSFCRGLRVEGPMSRVKGNIFYQMAFFFSELQIFSFKFFTRLWKTTTLKTPVPGFFCVPCSVLLYWV